MAGFDDDVVYGANVDFTGTFPVSGQINQDGELLIGAAIAPFIRAGLLTGSGGIAITNGAGTINIDGSGVSGGVTSVSGTANRITSTGGTTPVINIALTYVGQTSITTLGTITTGVWNGTTIAVANGGTGAVTLTNHGVLLGQTTSTIVATAAGSNGQVLIGATAADPAFATLSSSDSSITFTPGANTLSLQVSGGTTVGKTITGDSGGALSPTAGNWNLLGSGSITTSGSGSTLTTQLTGLTNHAVLVGAGTSTITKLALGSSGQHLQSQGASADPTWTTATFPATATSTGTILRADGTNWVATTATYPTTTTVSEILYSSSANVVSGLATANRGVLTTNATGVPVITAIATDGQIIIGSTSGAPAAATLTQGTGISISNGSNSITISSTGAMPWTDVTGTSQNAAVNNGYVANNAGLVTITLPAVFAVGDIVRVAGLNTGLWRLAANTGDIINFGSSPTSSGGSLTATNRYDCVEVVGVTANATWVVLSSVGNLTVA